MLTDTTVRFAIFLNGLFAGTFVGSALVEHAARTLDAAAWIAYKRAKETVFGAVMPGFLLSTLVVSLAAAVAWPVHLPFALTTALLAGVLAITVVVHLPINKRIQDSAPPAIPGAWNALRRRWRLWNWYRCALSVLAFGIALTALR